MDHLDNLPLDGDFNPAATVVPGILLLPTGWGC
jgi:hypothetical protein